MKRRILISAAAACLLALCAGGWFMHERLAAQPAAASAPQSSQSPQLQVQTINGETVLTIPADMQRASGIAVAPLASASLPAIQDAYAVVLDLQPLFDLGTRLAAACADRDAARAQVEASQAQAARMQGLYQDDKNVSRKAYDDARATAAADQARLAAAEAARAGVEGSIRQQFGDAVAKAAAVPQQGLWRALVGGQASLVRVNFRPQTRAVPETVTLDAADGGMLKASRLSPSLQADPALQGVAWLYLAKPAQPAGVHTLAHAGGMASTIGKPDVDAGDAGGTDSRDGLVGPVGLAGAAGAVGTGVLVPERAIVWYGDQRWVYVRTADNRFTRRLIPAPQPAPDGVIATVGVRAGDNVVVHGAALLLSEEQRPRGVATQCKYPPECDD